MTPSPRAPSPGTRDSLGHRPRCRFFSYGFRRSILEVVERLNESAMGTRKIAAVVLWSPMVIAAAAAATWSLLPRQPDAMPEARKTDRDAPLARKGDYLVPRVKPPPDLAARWVPLAPAVKMRGGLPNDDSPSTGGPSSTPSGPPSSPASEPARAEATPHHQVRVRPDRDVCAAHGMRREDFYQNNRWRSWRCVR